MSPCVSIWSFHLSLSSGPFSCTLKHPIWYYPACVFIWPFLWHILLWTDPPVFAENLTNSISSGLLDMLSFSALSCSDWPFLGSFTVNGSSLNFLIINLMELCGMFMALDFFHNPTLGCISQLCPWPVCRVLWSSCCSQLGDSSYYVEITAVESTPIQQYIDSI